MHCHPSELVGPSTASPAYRRPVFSNRSQGCAIYRRVPTNKLRNSTRMPMNLPTFSATDEQTTPARNPPIGMGAHPDMSIHQEVRLSQRRSAILHEAAPTIDGTSTNWLDTTAAKPTPNASICRCSQQHLAVRCVAAASRSLQASPWHASVRTLEGITNCWALPR